VQCAQRVALIGIVERQDGHSFWVGSPGRRRRGRQQPVDLANQQEEHEGDDHEVENGVEEHAANHSRDTRQRPPAVRTSSAE
jgi:hypothetical protein